MVLANLVLDILNIDGLQAVKTDLVRQTKGALRRRQEEEGRVKDWLHQIGIGDRTTAVHDNDEPDDGAIPVNNEDSVRKRSIRTRAALPIIMPSIGRSTVSERARVAMQNYLDHFLGNIDVVNTHEFGKNAPSSNALEGAIVIVGGAV
ncbi:phospholipase D zeta 1-like protein [Tanacetum coccineum]|uniref:Phospholipase D zeta 1-like protein n=1 Tax=Tanacetum coccineum TaxID=301880 RepID=A0ABQ5D6S7_9ASTR